MPSHNPECTHGGAHGPSECRDRYARHLKPIEDAPGATPVAHDPISANLEPLTVSQAENVLSEPSGLTDADREALRAALAGLVPVGADEEPNSYVPGFGEPHDPYRDPDADADAAQRVD